MTELKTRIQSARLSAARSVNSDLILLYWDIGRAIVEKQEQLGWGESVVELLSRDLQQAFPGLTGFSAFNLWRMRQLYMVHSSPEFVAQLVPVMQQACSASEPKHILAQLVPELLATIPWGHHVELLKKVKDHKARLFYLHAAAKLGWSHNVLLNQINARAFERSLAEGKTHNFPAVLPEYFAEQAEEALKGSVEKCRQRRSRRLVVLTYSSVRSARPSGCGLAGRAFLNTPLFFPVRGSGTHLVMKRQNMRNIQ